MQRLFLILFMIFTLCGFSQTSSDTEVKIARKEKKWDTLKYQKFETVLIVGIYQQRRGFSNEFKQLMTPDSAGLSVHTYSTESDFTGVAGITVNYDKFQISVGKGVKPPDNAGGKGHTQMFNIGLNVGDNRWVSETYYRRFKGFYDQNRTSLDSASKAAGKYNLQPNMLSTLFMGRFMHFRNNKKFSYKAGFGCNYRQLKSAISFISGGSFSVYHLRNDSTILPVNSRSLYRDYANLKGFRSVNLAANIGIAGTLVIFKAWFATGYFTLGPEQQWRSYDLTSNHRNISYIGWSGTGRVSVGLNMKRFYLLSSFTSDYNRYNSPKIMDYSTVSYTTNFTFGWRFHYDTPKFYQKFQQSDVYNML